MQGHNTAFAAGLQPQFRRPGQLAYGARRSTPLYRSPVITPSLSAAIFTSTG
jgi:hypothetical protein